MVGHDGIAKVLGRRGELLFVLTHNQQSVSGSRGVEGNLKSVYVHLVLDKI